MPGLPLSPGRRGDRMKTVKKTERNGEVSKAEALEFYRQLRTHNLPYFEAPKLLKRIWKCSRSPK